VLPFADMSADRDQEYFNNGLAEELLNAFAKIDELKEGRKRA
jgi:TolB-like protein